MDFTRQDDDGLTRDTQAFGRQEASGPAGVPGGAPARGRGEPKPASPDPGSRPGQALIRGSTHAARRAVGRSGRAPLRPFFATAPVACPYIAGRAERKLIAELDGDGAPAFYDDLSRAGFRRSHRFAYRPACRGCAACVPVRIVVDRFVHTRSSWRVVNLNRDLTGLLVAPRATAEQFRLFWIYQRTRHGGGEMAAMSYADYRAMVEDTPVRTAIAEFRDGGGALVAASLIDLLDDGISAVYSFYDSRQAKRSLGTWSILWLLEECRRRAQPYVYLGYWIADSPKMAYKARFTGLERLVPGGWVDFPRPTESFSRSPTGEEGRGEGASGQR